MPLFARKPYKVIPLGRTGIQYSEGGKSVAISSELLTDPNFDMVIEISLVEHWDPPHEAERIDSVKKVEMRRNIDASLRGIRVKWE